MVAGIITDLTDWLDRTSGHQWFLLVILVIAFLDSVIPVVPSETCVIIGGVAASQGTQNIYAVIAAGAIGAFLGDNGAYQIGMRASAWFERRAERKPKFAVKLAWAQTHIMQRGGLLLITARFIPGGRTALTLSCGITRQSRWWFVRWVALATIVWATYAAMLGRVGGEAFENNHTKAFVLAFGLAIATNIVIEVTRHQLKKRRRRATQFAAADHQ
ncbi:MAG TPA: DedA family protein [Ilumatobacteraceae bacterium]|jgi:membrane protein DedA with SNARE-associated domain